MPGPPQRVVAALLPFSFLFVFMACVSICERETLANHPPTDLRCSAEINSVSNVPDCDGCPLSYFPKATTPDRAKFKLGFDTLPSFAPVIPSIHSYHSKLFCDRRNIPGVNGTPPLKLLALRI